MVWIFLYLAGRDAGMNIFTFIIFIFMSNSMLKEGKENHLRCHRDKVSLVYLKQPGI